MMLVTCPSVTWRGVINASAGGQVLLVWGEVSWLIARLDSSPWPEGKGSCWTGNPL